MTRPDKLPWTGDEEADRLLARSGLALLLGMLLDQQFPMERAFYGPYLLSQRLGRELDAALVADYPAEELAAIFRGPPAIHRFPGAMAARAQAVCRVVVEEYGGEAETIWTTAASGEELLSRLKALPGFGDAKSRIFVGILGKRLQAAPPGWEAQAADWPSIADVAAWEDVTVLRDEKRRMKSRS